MEFRKYKWSEDMVLIKTAPAHSGAEIEIKLGYKL